MFKRTLLAVAVTVLVAPVLGLQLGDWRSYVAAFIVLLILEGAARLLTWHVRGYVFATGVRAASRRARSCPDPGTDPRLGSTHPEERDEPPVTWIRQL